MQIEEDYSLCAPLNGNSYSGQMECRCSRRRRLHFLNSQLDPPLHLFRAPHLSVFQRAVIFQSAHVLYLHNMTRSDDHPEWTRTTYVTMQSTFALLNAVRYTRSPLSQSPYYKRLLCRPGPDQTNWPLTA